MFSQTVDLPVSTALQIFDAKILPILLYGSELWGFSPHSSVIRVYDRFHKYILGLSFRCINNIALGELGRPSFSYFSQVRLISFWLRLLKHNEQRYTKICYNELFFQIQNDFNSQNWAGDVKRILYSTGFGYVWDNQGIEDSQLFLSEFKQRLLDIDRQNWVGEIHKMESLRSYVKFKFENCAESYVLFLNNFSLRRALARFRCCAVDLEVNTGRKNKTPLHLRICKFCSLNQIDDEFHFLFVCPLLNDLRVKYIPRYYLQYPNDNSIPNLLSSPSASLCKQLSMYIINSFKLRHGCE